jgi:hypothetical protein
MLKPQRQNLRLQLGKAIQPPPARVSTFQECGRLSLRFPRFDLQLRNLKMLAIAI